jgi:hypothetical protein
VWVTRILWMGGEDFHGPPFTVQRGRSGELVYSTPLSLAMGAFQLNISNRILDWCYTPNEFFEGLISNTKARRTLVVHTKVSLLLRVEFV